MNGDKMPCDNNSLVSLNTDAQPISSSSTTESFSEFRPFPKLPIELRLMIWEFRFPREPIIVRSQMHYGRSLYHKQTFLCPLPINFQINNESRRLSLKKYTAFPTGYGDQTIYINLSLDKLFLKDIQLCFDDEFWFKNLKPEPKDIFANIRHVELRQLEWSEQLEACFADDPVDTWVGGKTTNFLRHFKNLKMLECKTTWVLDDHPPEDDQKGKQDLVKKYFEELPSAKVPEIEFVIKRSYEWS